MDMGGAEGEATPDAVEQSSYAYEPPDMGEALQHRERTRPWQVVGSLRTRYSLWGTEALDLGQLGIGIGLYFHVLKVLAGVLLALSAVSGVIILFNWLAFWSVAQRSLYQALTGYTLAGMADDPADPESGDVDLVLGLTLPKEDVLLAISIADTVIMVLFLGVVYYLYRRQANDAEDISLANTTLGDYTVQVNRLPAKTNPDVLKEHFEQFGEVVDVVVARNDGRLVHLLEHRKKYASQLETVEASMAKYGAKKFLQQRRQSLDAKVAVIEAGILQLSDKTDFDCVAGFVTFNAQASCSQCLRAYPDNVWGYLTQPKPLRLQGERRLRVRQAPEPDNIVWENLEYGSFHRHLLSTFSALVTAGLLAISLALAVSAKSYEARLPPTVSCSVTEARRTLLCSTLWDLNSTHSNSDPVRVQVDQYKAGASGTTCKTYTDGGVFSENVTAMIEGKPMNASQPLPLDRLGSCAALTCYGCYCESLPVQSLLSNANDVTSYCRDFFVNQGLTAFLRALAIGFVALINLLLYVLLPALTRQEKHHQLTHMEAATAEKVFVSQLLNAGVIAMLVYAHLDYVPIHTIRKVAFNGLYRDFDPSWYNDVGTTIVYTLAIQTVLPFIVTGIFISWAAIKRLAFASYQVTQRDLNKLMECPGFTLSERYGQLLTLVFVTFMFSPGMPLLVPLLAVALTLTYWMDKATLLLWSKAPAQYDESMSAMLLQVLPWAVWLHSAMAAYVFGGLPSQALDSVTATVQDTLQADPPAQFDLITRLSVVNALPPLVLWSLLSLFLLLRPFTAALSSLAALFWHSNKVAPELGGVTLQQAMEEGRLQGLPSYNKSDNPRYQLIERLDAFRTLDKSARARLLQNLDASLLPPKVSKVVELSVFEPIPHNVQEKVDFVAKPLTSRHSVKWESAMNDVEEFQNLEQAPPYAKVEGSDNVETNVGAGRPKTRGSILKKKVPRSSPQLHDEPPHVPLDNEREEAVYEAVPRGDDSPERHEDYHAGSSRGNLNSEDGTRRTDTSNEESGYVHREPSHRSSPEPSPGPPKRSQTSLLKKKKG